MQLRNFIAYLRYYWQATTIYHVQPPFAYELANAVLRDRRWYYAFDELNAKYRAFDHSFGRQLFRLILLLKPQNYCFLTQTKAVADYHAAAHSATVVQVESSNNSGLDSSPDQMWTRLRHLYLDDLQPHVEGLLKNLAETAVVIVPYPHLQAANWNLIQANLDISLTLDFYTFGLALKHPDLTQKQHFVLIPWWKKPWLIGLFV